MNKKALLLIIIFLLIGLSLIFIFNRQEGEIITDDLTEFEVFFSTKDAMYLQAELRQLDRDDIYLDGIRQLIVGPNSNQLSATIPEGVEIIDIDIRGEIAYLNFNRALVDNHWGGSTGELITVYSIVNTMTGFSNIDGVQIVIEGQEVETLVGHLDLSQAIRRDDDIIQERK